MSPIQLDRRAILLGMAGAALAPPARAALPEAQPVPIELFEEARELEAAVPVGSSRPDVTMIEFFDYNCPYCRRSAADLPALLQAEPDLQYIVVNYAVLGAASVQAARAALAYADLYGPERYAAFHLELFGVRGRIDGAVALDTAERLGADRPRLTGLADSGKVTGRMKEALRVGSSLGLVATPSFVIGPEAYGGELSIEQKRALVARART
jgi:protein-disulfide isomerase